MPRRTMAFRWVGDIQVVLHMDQPPSQEEWDAYLPFWKERLGSTKAIVVRSHGGGPNARQREQSLRLFVGNYQPPRLALLTSSVIARGVLTAFSWFVKTPGKAFGVNDWDKAFAFVKLTAEEGRQVRQALEEMERELLSQ